jgi:Integrase zinc binding domain
MNGWPRYAKEFEKSMKVYYSVRSELSVNQGILIKGDSIVIPGSLRADIVSKIHEGHIDINTCRERAKQSVWWPGISSEIQRIVSSCNHCEKKNANK